ncbi:pyridoxamine 5'-phosphate oxidase [Parapedobacter soli]|uniref:pyridoxamine 5'-phosphate oxidase n=1 Tax=Parapedobacter soli TaxID=416955 RepID=UPI0021C86486|nr:pyridoxamine 5'-phosphate oxidase [Parapedobacter soli]
MTLKRIDIGVIRTAYKMGELSEDELRPDPIEQFRDWFEEALEKDVMEPNAMTLATVSSNGQPSARIVLLKDLDDNGFGFFTNYESQKGVELQGNPKAALLFFWPELQRQVRVVGRVSKMSAEQSETYFHSRPRGSQLGAIASPQSREITGRETLSTKLDELEQQYKDGTRIPRPSHWGGYRLHPDRIEFWQGGDNRLHDRLVYTQQGTEWEVSRLAP